MKQKVNFNYQAKFADLNFYFHPKMYFRCIVLKKCTYCTFDYREIQTMISFLFLKSLCGWWKRFLYIRKTIDFRFHPKVNDAQVQGSFSSLSFPTQTFLLSHHFWFPLFLQLISYLDTSICFLKAKTNPYLFCQDNRDSSLKIQNLCNFQTTNWQLSFLRAIFKDCPPFSGRSHEHHAFPCDS